MLGVISEQQLTSNLFPVDCLHLGKIAGLPVQNM